MQGWEYGMLRSFEKAIETETGASVVEIPAYKSGFGFIHHFAHGMDRAVYRKYFPRQQFQLATDTVWYILMGPENYRLDLYNGWKSKSKLKILYLYDTLPGQYPLIKRLFSNNTWDVLITSFNDSVADLEKITGRKWYCVEQAADRDLFQPIPSNEKIIHFSSYGRRDAILHEVVKEFCSKKGLYYDYTTHDAKHPVANPEELYKQYAWHLTHSLFTISLPVEFTSPQRARHLRPITCRWFEAAAAGTVLLGKKPGNTIFDQALNENIVVAIDPGSSKQKLYKDLETIWNNRSFFLEKAFLLRTENIHRWTWNDRVKQILSLL